MAKICRISSTRVSTSLILRTVSSEKAQSSRYEVASKGSEQEKEVSGQPIPMVCTWQKLKGRVQLVTLQWFDHASSVNTSSVHSKDDERGISKQEFHRSIPPSRIQDTFFRECLFRCILNVVCSYNGLGHFCSSDSKTSILGCESLTKQPTKTTT